MLDTQSPFTSKTAPDAVSLTESRLRTAIITGALLPGARLSEIELCDVYGQGRGIVRMALARLAHGGFVISQPRSGWRVSAISAAGLREVIMARGRLETLLAEVSLSSANLESMRTICNMEAALRSAPSAATSEHRALCRGYDRQIREMLAAELKAPLIATWLRNIWDKSERYLNFFDRSGIRAAPWFDWLMFIEAKSLGMDEKAASLLSEGCAALARFAQASLLDCDLVAAEPLQKKSKASLFQGSARPEPSHRRERHAKRTI